MLYQLLKVWVGIGLNFFCVEIKINKREILNTKGPLLIAANHPNSFLDALLFGVLCKHPVLFLARGDVFKNYFVRKIMSWAHMWPIYRLSEGKENLSLNDATFNKSVEVLEKNGIVLIFIEGLCVNEWKLRNFKKGTARIALSCKQKNIPLQILPAGINYSSFKYFGKKIFLELEELIHVNEVSSSNHTATWLNDFNTKLFQKIKPLVWENKENFKPIEVEEKFMKSHNLNDITSTQYKPTQKSYLQKICFGILTILNGLLYFPIKTFVRNQVKETVHYDAVLAACLILFYPLYMILISAIIYKIFSSNLIAIIFFFTSMLITKICIRVYKK